MLVGLSSFRDRAHHDELMRELDNDEHLGRLYTKMTTLLDIGRVVRGEFEQVV